ncbi:MAG: alpha-xylosidase [Bacteroidales bacterium]|nr:alpha-xylosidase [Bacteroidales bacterium]
MTWTNNYLFDFLDLDPLLQADEALWRACRPSSISQSGDDVVVTIPFQKQARSSEVKADTGTPRVNYTMVVRDYGNKILRVAIGFGEAAMQPSPMLQFSDDLAVSPLHFEKDENEWVITGKNGCRKAVINFRGAEIDHWSDLLPAPDETLDITFLPDGVKEIKISAYDQFFPARHDALALAYVEKDGVPQRAVVSFYTGHDEKFAGTGERFVKTDLSGKTFLLENQDGQGVNSRRTYKNVPFYISSRLYGLFLHTSAHTKISFADISTRSVQLLAEQPLVDLFLISGDSIEEILFHYRQITGFPALPPLWSFGVWMSRMTYFSADEVTTICNRLREKDYPCDVIHLDTGWFKTDWLCEWKFNPERFPEPEKFIAELKSKGFRVSLWQLPYIAYGAEQLEEAVKNRFIGISKNKQAGDGSNFSSLDYAGTIDFTSPKATEWYKGLLKKLLAMGVACIKTDFGETIHMDAQYENMKPELLHNIYALLYQKAAYEVTRETTGEGIIWSRAGWAGCQRYPLHWGGDAACSWDGMAGSLKGGLHLGLSGFAFWSHDVPGFHGVPDFMNSVVPDDLYVRWTQFGVFTSHIRYHGTSKREPYEYPNISSIIKKWWRLRYALIPYIYEQGRKSTMSGFPLLRALIMHHAEDKMCWQIHDQYYFGDDFLVAPVMSSTNKRDVYLPEGTWVNLFDGGIANGAVWLKEYEASLEEMPVWVRFGAIVPYYPEKVCCTDEMDLTKTKNLVFDDTYRGLYKSEIGKVIENE